MKATFENTVDILVKAYMNNTLENGNCCACAVGNLVACSLGINFIPANNLGILKIQWENGEYPSKDHSGGWGEILSTSENKLSNKALEQINSTGYTVLEISKIEYAFEHSETITNDKIFNGLMAVVDVVAEIHGVSLEQSKEAKLMFVKSC